MDKIHRTGGTSHTGKTKLFFDTTFAIQTIRYFCHMQLKRRHKWWLMLAVVIIQLHAILPHCHFESEGTSLACVSQTTDLSKDTHSHFPCHPDLGEHHLEDLTAQKQLFVFVKPLFEAVLLPPVTQKAKRYWVPLEVTFQHHFYHKQHARRGPPVFA